MLTESHGPNRLPPSDSVGAGSEQRSGKVSSAHGSVPEGTDVHQANAAGVSNRLSALEYTVAGFEAFLSITLMERLHRIVDEKIGASEAVLARARRTSRLLAVSLIANGLLLAVLFVPFLRAGAVAFAAKVVAGTSQLIGSLAGAVGAWL